MDDRDTTVDALRRDVLAMCRRKGWGINGVQNPQHVAMAMTVEMSEVLEHFQWLNDEDVARLMAGDDPRRTQLIAEEMADVACYALQLTGALGIDLASEIRRKIAIVDKRPPKEYDPAR